MIVMAQWTEAIRCISADDTDGLKKILKNSPDVVHELHNVERQDTKWTLLHFAVHKNKETMCSLLLEHGANVDKQSEKFLESPLHIAMNNHVDISIVGILLKHKPNCEATNKFFHTALLDLFYDATDRRGDFQVEKFKLLLESGAGVNDLHSEADPIHMVSHVWHSRQFDEIHRSFKLPLCVEIADLLIKHGANVNQQDSILRTPLMYAAHHGCSALLKFFLEQGSNSDAEDENGLTALLYLCKSAHPQVFNCYRLEKEFVDNRQAMFDLLVSYGAHISQTNNVGEGPLHFLFADLSFSTKCLVAQFIKEGLDVNATNYRHESALHYIDIDPVERPFAVVSAVIKHGYIIDLVDMMVKNGANIDISDINGRSPLLSALQRHHFYLAYALTKYGCNVSHVDKFGNGVMFYFLECHKIPTKEELCFLLEDKIPKTEQLWENQFPIMPFMIPLDDEVYEPVSETQKSVSFVHALSDTIPNQGLTKRVLTWLEHHKSSNGADSAIQWKSLLTCPGIGKQAISGGFLPLKKQVDLLMSRIAAGVAKKDPLMKFTAVLSGSLSEDTKVGCLDEFDYLLYMDEYPENVCEVKEGDALPAFVDVWFRIDKMSPYFQQCHDTKTGVVKGNAAFFGSYLYSLIQQVLGDHDVWEALDFYWEGGPCKCLFGNDEISMLVLQWMGIPDSPLKFTIDLAPVVLITNWWSKHLKRMTPELHNMGSLIVLSKPLPDNWRDESGWEASMRLSFSHIERYLFSIMPESVKDGYRLCKVLLTRNIRMCFTSSRNFISTYMLKTAFLCILHDKCPEYVKKNDPDLPKLLAIDIFKMLISCFAERRIPFYSLPDVEASSDDAFEVVGDMQQMCALMVSILEGLK